MAAPPQLNEQGMTLLKLLASRRDYLRGGEAMRMLKMEREPFVQLVMDLASKNLVQISGPISNEKIDFATLAVHPSNFGFVHSL